MRTIYTNTYLYLIVEREKKVRALLESDQHDTPARLHCAMLSNLQARAARAALIISALISLRPHRRVRHLNKHQNDAAGPSGDARAESRAHCRCSESGFCHMCRDDDDDGQWRRGCSGPAHRCCVCTLDLCLYLCGQPCIQVAEKVHFVVSWQDGTIMPAVFVYTQLHICPCTHPLMHLHVH